MAAILENFMFDKEKHRYYFGGTRVTGITEALSNAGITPPIPTSARHNFVAAGRRGTIIHQGCEIIDLKQEDNFDLDPELKGYFDAWRSFCYDYGYEVSLVEVPLGHDIFLFGGIPDSYGLCKKLGGLAVVERKSTEFKDWMEFQVEGQKILLEHHNMPVEHKVVVSIQKTGKYRVEKCAYSKSRALFLSAVAISNWKLSKENIR